MQLINDKLASLKKKTEIENSFKEMKAILEALRKEVSILMNAGTPDSNLTRCDVHRYRHSKGLKMPLLKQCFHLNGLKIFRKLTGTSKKKFSSLTK